MLETSRESHRRVAKSWAEQQLPRFRKRRAKTRNHNSTWLRQEPCVGGKWNTC